MRLNYYADTDSPYIDLSEQPSAESREISEGVVLDYDSAGNLVGIDIDNASTKVQLDTLVLGKLPGTVRDNRWLTPAWSRWRSTIKCASPHRTAAAQAEYVNSR